jgi:hypothetical protein
MYLSPNEIRQTRLDSLDHLHVASRAWIEATEKLSSLALRAGRQFLAEGSSHIATLNHSGAIKLDALPLERFGAWRDQSAKLVREYFTIIGDAQQAMLQVARAQMAVLDKSMLERMDHAAHNSDASGAAAIEHVKNVIKRAEAGFDEMTQAALHGTQRLEAQVRQVSDALSTPVEAVTVAEPVIAEPVAAAAAKAAPRARKPRATKAAPSAE